MIEITIPAWLVWMFVGVMVLSAINTTLDILIHYRKAEIEKLKRDRALREQHE